MSYILNALRKSEQERKALQSEIVSGLPLAPDNMKSSARWIKGIAVIAVINVLALAYLFFKLQQVPATADRTTPLLPPSPVTLDHLVEQPKDTSLVDTTQPVVPLKSAPAISDLVTENQKVAENEAPKTLAIKPKPTIKKSSLPKTAPKQSEKPLLTLPEEADDAPAVSKSTQAVIAAVNEENELSEKIIVSPSNKSSISLLRELSADFQAKVPPININVFAYAEQPNNRFIIVDMVKYKIGQRVKQQISILNILPDSVLLRFEGQDFRIERP
jgi:general secretion pathway protein B